MSPTPAAFRDLLLELDAAALTAFVAAVYAARGWELDRDGDDLRVRPAGARDWRRLVVAPVDRQPTDADGVVVPTLVPDADGAGTGEPAVVDAAALLELLRYAVDDAARARLFRDFFDCEPDAFEGPAAVDDGGGTGTADAPSDSTSDAPTDSPTNPRADDSATSDSSFRHGRRLVVAVAILSVVGVLAVVVGPTLAPTGEDAATGADAPTDTPAQTPDDAGSASAATDRSVPSTHAGVAVAAGPLPPGVDATGIENASTLADAHEAALSDRSYRLSVVAREFVGGRPTAVARERAVVEGPTRYRSDVSVIGTFRQQPRAIGTSSAYADGTMRFVRLTTATEADGTIRFTERGRESGTAGGPGWRSVAVDPAVDPFANRTAAHLRSVLDVDDAAVVGSFEREGTTYVWIDLRRRPPGGTDAIDSVLVDEHGLVHEIRHEYAYLPPESSTVRTVVTVRIEPTNATASPPPWLDVE